MRKVTFVVACLSEKMNMKNFPFCVNSIEQQTGIQKELIVLTDFEDELNIENHTHGQDDFQIIYENHPGLTLGALRNLGLQKATGEYVCFVDPNDFLVKNVMRNVVDAMEEGNHDILIGETMLYHPKNETYTRKYKDRVFKVNPTVSVEDLSLLKDMNLKHKVFKRQFLTNHQLTFSDTKFYDYVAFQIQAFLKNPRVSMQPIHFYSERVRDGLDKVYFPTLEASIDSQQVVDLVSIFFELYRPQAEDELTLAINDMIIKRYLNFIFKRGLNYLNVVSQPELIFKELAKPLQVMNFETLKVNNRQKKLLELLKSEDVEAYFVFIKEEKAEKLKNKDFSKHIQRQLFIQLYDWSSKLSVKNKHILFISHSPGMDGNYSYIKEAIDQYNLTVEPKDRFTYSFTTSKLSKFGKLCLPFKLARSEFVLVAEYVPFFQLLNFREDTKVVQTWHAAGAFKKFGYSTSYLEGGPNPFKNSKMHLHRGYDYATVSSEEVRKHYAEAFDMDIEKVIPVGLPRADFFFNEEAVANMRTKLYDLYPALKGKKVILYAPTFRGFGKKRAKFNIEFDFNRMAKEISDDYIIALKLHPSVKLSDITIDPEMAHKVVDLSAYSDANDVLTITDLLITDYSSIIFDYSLMNKPMVFFAYDLDEYRYDRDFYYDYESFVPGPIAKTNDELISIINQNEFDLEKVKQFSETFFINQEGNYSEQFVQEVLVKLSR